MLDGDTFVFIAVGWVGVSFFFLQRLSKEGRIVRRGQEKKVLQQQSLETEIVQTNSRILVPMVVNLCALLHVFFFLLFIAVGQVLQRFLILSRKFDERPI